MPNFARACGRVLVGGHPDKRPDSRQGHKGFALGDWISRGKDPGSQDPRPEQRPAAGGETGEPRSPRGTQLKATTERAFLVSSALQRSTPKRLVHLARRAVGVSPSKQWQLLGRRARPTPLVSPSHGRRGDSSPLSPGGSPPATLASRPTRPP